MVESVFDTAVIRMGKRSPVAKTTNLQTLHSDRKDRINDAEPIPPAAKIVCSDRPSEQAREIWTRLTPGLESHGVQTARDSDAFLVSCEALARYCSATQLATGQRCWSRVVRVD
ncbi:hypothetical protein [Amycolatopsis sp. NBC_01480]|uniref:hypothetical protein n=1 Tax=Amycolatopsis sp. NBC_01480 TaxID=2903562 RepID=UPI002E28F8D2|nr:hypothetical protein [Amycolatopsis sp. NBC_01480]